MRGEVVINKGIFDGLIIHEILSHCVLEEQSFIFWNDSYLFTVMLRYKHISVLLCDAEYEIIILDTVCLFLIK